jgi:hypothetical protein
MKASIVETEKVPNGLVISQLDNTELIELVALARQDVENLLKSALKGQIASNQHCYINLPHPLTVENFREAYVPVFSWGSPEIKNIEALFSVALIALGLSVDDMKPRANVIVREYKQGQHIPFHYDELECSSEVCGIILLNDDPDHRGLCFQRGGSRNEILNYTVREKPGSIFVFSDEARYAWKHGLQPVRARRISITCRFYKKDVIAKWAKDMELATLERGRTVIEYDDTAAVDGKAINEKVRVTICDFQNRKKSKVVIINSNISLDELKQIFKNKLSVKAESIHFGNDGTEFKNGSIIKQDDLLLGKKK